MQRAKKEYVIMAVQNAVFPYLVLRPTVGEIRALIRFSTHGYDSKRTQRIYCKKTTSVPVRTVGIEADVLRQLHKASKELKVSSTKYASAAIAYFTERGLDPISNHQREGVVIQAKVDKRADQLQEQITTLGDRLFGFMKQQERNMYTYFGNQQKALFFFLQKQENSLFNHLSEQEQKVFVPLLQEVVRGATDAFIARRLGEQIVLRQQNAFDKWLGWHQEQNESHQQMTTKRLTEIASANVKPPLERTAPPALTTTPIKPPTAPPAASTTPVAPAVTAAPAPEKNTY